MSWQLKGKIVGACSCKMSCRCLLGPAEPDQGWCSDLQSISIEQGSSEGVDLGGTRAAVGLQLPGDFFGGVELARLYLDESTSDSQRTELEAIFKGERGGVWAGLKDAIGRWLPTTVTSVQIDTGDSPSFSVGGVGGTTLTRLKTSDGRQATINNAPVAEGFAIDVVELAQAEKSLWKDPEMREWENWGFGRVEAFNWSG